MPVTITNTRDLVRFRKFTSPLLSTLTNSYINLLSLPSPSSTLLRTAFLPALLASSTKPREASELKALDEKLIDLFSNAAADQGGLELVVVQGLVKDEMVKTAWRNQKEGMMDKLFLGFALHSELEEARRDGEKEVEANLSMMILATLTYELAHWIFVKTHDYHPVLNSSTSSIYASASISVTSLASTIGGGAGSGRPSPDDVGEKALLALIGVDFELLAYTIGERQLVKRRSPLSRRTPLLTPPLIYSLIGDSPSILDVSAYPATVTRVTPPWKEEDSNTQGSGMYAVVSLLRPCGVGNFHGVCKTGNGGSETSDDSEN